MRENFCLHEWWYSFPHTPTPRKPVVSGLPHGASDVRRCRKCKRTEITIPTFPGCCMHERVEPGSMFYPPADALYTKEMRKARLF